MLCIQGMLHGIEPGELEEDNKVDPKQADKERSNQLHARHHAFLKGEFDQLL